MKKINHILWVLCAMFWLMPCSNAQTPGLLLGMTYRGGSAYNSGTMFSYDPLSSSYKVLIDFNGYFNGGAPQGDLLQANNGLVYGMCQAGGPNGGLIFSYNLATGYDTVLHYFKNNPDGAYPLGSLIQAKDGKLYGMTSAGGTFGYGTLFSFNPVNDSEKVLLSFNDTNGNQPQGSLIQARDGKLYGMTRLGGTGTLGVLFSYDPVALKDSVRIVFSGPNGAYPYGNLVEDTNGLLYGMTSQGGIDGVLFSFNPTNNNFTILRNLRAATGYYPYGSLIHDSNGVLYGMTSHDSLSTNGVIFSYNPTTNIFTVLHDFNDTNGAYPNGTPMFASNGLMYGMTNQGGVCNPPTGSGMLFDYNLTAMREDTLFSFNNNVPGSGYNPYGGLIEAMTVTLSAKDSLRCYGDSNGWAKVNVRGAKPPLHFNWSNGSTADSIGGLKAGVYTCIIHDTTGKTFTVPVIVYQPPKLNANVAVQNTCGGNNGKAWASANGGILPYTFSWSNSATTDTISSLVPGNYTCTVTDSNGCISQGTVKVDTAKALKIDSIKTTPAWCPACTNGTVTVYVSGGIPYGDSALYFYVWSNGPGGATDSNVAAGVDSVCITSYYGCGSICTAATVLVGIPSVNDINNVVKIYPNPNNGIFNVSITNYELRTGSNMKIYNTLGEEVYAQPFNTQHSTFSIDVSNLPSGIYIMQLITNQGIIARKLVIQK